MFALQFYIFGFYPLAYCSCYLTINESGLPLFASVSLARIEPMSAWDAIVLLHMSEMTISCYSLICFNINRKLWDLRHSDSWSAGLVGYFVVFLYQLLSIRSDIRRIASDNINSPRRELYSLTAWMPFFRFPFNYIHGNLCLPPPSHAIQAIFPHAFNIGALLFRPRIAWQNFQPLANGQRGNIKRPLSHLPNHSHSSMQPDKGRTKGQHC